MPLRFLHVSDIHLLDLTGVKAARYLNKRITGWVNLRFRRGKKHDGRIFDEIARCARQMAVDRFVVTGDLTNLALEPEFALCRDKLDGVGVPVTVIPGNHDTYTKGSARTRRFEEYLGHLMDGERVEEGTDYPFVQRFDKVALIGVSTAIPTLPMYATGRVGAEQLARLDRVLGELAHQDMMRVVLIHHPVTEGMARPRHELLDLAQFGAVIRERGAELILHGHEHRLYESSLPGPDGPVPVHGITSGTAVSQSHEYKAAFSIYTVSSGQIDRELWQWDGRAFAQSVG